MPESAPGTASAGYGKHSVIGAGLRGGDVSSIDCHLEDIIISVGDGDIIWVDSVVINISACCRCGDDVVVGIAVDDVVIDTGDGSSLGCVPVD